MAELITEGIKALLDTPEGRESATRVTGTSTNLLEAVKALGLLEGLAQFQLQEVEYVFGQFSTETQRDLLHEAHEALVNGELVIDWTESEDGSCYFVPRSETDRTTNKSTTLIVVGTPIPRLDPESVR